MKLGWKTTKISCNYDRSTEKGLSLLNGKLSTYKKEKKFKCDKNHSHRF
jgi:hypothetical protein